jgi:hypothetical protein
MHTELTFPGLGSGEGSGLTRLRFTRLVHRPAKFKGFLFLNQIFLPRMEGLSTPFLQFQFKTQQCLKYRRKILNRENYSSEDNIINWIFYGRNNLLVTGKRTGN